MDNKYTAIIGMEIHIELKTNSKMFCSCANDPDETEPNKNICEICLGHPGTLPLPNKQAIIWATKMAKALNCQINPKTKFDRKHYFYPDLPKGYQISQYDLPIGYNGYLDLILPLENIRQTARIKINRLHIEEDTAKIIKNQNKNLIDFNRSGVPLIEIVTNPVFKTALEAKIYCQELQSIARYLDISDANMEKGQMRCEANISVQETGKFEITEQGEVKPLGNYILNNKVELKNLNSFKAIEKAINYEIKRQINLLEKNEAWSQQTRGWNENKQETILQRLKENAADYRYFPEPDIPPFEPLKLAGQIKLPELPNQKRQRFQEEYGFAFNDAQILTSDEQLANFTEQVMSELNDWLNNQSDFIKQTQNKQKQQQWQLAKLAGNWIINKLGAILKENKQSIKDIKFNPENFAELIILIYTKQVNSTNAQKILNIMFNSQTNLDPSHVLEEQGLGQISNESALEKIIEKIITDYQQQVEEYKKGKEPILKFLIGMVMRATEGGANPQIVEKMLKDKLK